MPFPTVDELVEIANRTTATITYSASPAADAAKIRAMQALVRGMPIANHVTTFTARLVKATHPESADSPSVVNQFVRFGASPRGMQAMILAGKIIAMLDGRNAVAFDDIRQAATPALRHRLILNFEAQAEGMSADRIIAELLQAIIPEKMA